MVELEATTIYSLPEIADKLATGETLNEIECQMAAGTIRDWIRLRASQTGRPRKWKSMQEKNAFYNAKRRAK